MRRVSLSLLILLLACLAAGPVYAGCSNPNGNEADVIYNQAYHTYQFCNGSTWISEGGSGGAGPLFLISTQTASSSASLQFTNLPTTYNTLFMNCEGLLVSGGSSANIYIRVGEGATPTWEIGAHYTVTAIWTGTGNSSVQQSIVTNATDLTSAGGGSTTKPYTVKLYIDNVGSSTAYKQATFISSQYIDGSGYFAGSGSGYWNIDTNPITGLEVIPSTGTITSGTCSLYGMN